MQAKSGAAAIPAKAFALLHKVRRKKKYGGVGTGGAGEEGGEGSRWWPWARRKRFSASDERKRGNRAA